ncbi:RNA recognition motif domain containing protein [Rhodotorula toruloides]|uniref:RNA recognition motif domain containing protein n=1 Tax=Rhodotorula toruloides TaxID=5286 RepID=A0A511KKK7_RHOTO|nr:RNA recognition motif domain containing protein [Rhodotorula toruloides]
MSQPFPSTPLALSQTASTASSHLTSPPSALKSTWSASHPPLAALPPVDQTPNQSISFSSSAFKFDSPLSSLSTPNTSFAFSPLALRPSQAKSDLSKITPAALEWEEDGLDDPPSPTGYVSQSSPFYSHPNEPIEVLNWSFPPLRAESALSTSPGPLSPGEYADDHPPWEDEDTSDFGVKVELPFAARRESSAWAADSVPADEESSAEENFECGGCGAAKNDAFTPCGHPACPTCMNALVNAVAHKPPRPSNCFACVTFVDSFEPAVAAVKIENGGCGLVEAFFSQLAKEKRGREQKTSGDNMASVGSMRRSSPQHRRSSIVAASPGSKARLVDESDGEYTASPLYYWDKSFGLGTSPSPHASGEVETVHFSTKGPFASTDASPKSTVASSNDVGVFGSLKASKSVPTEREASQTDTRVDNPRADTDLSSSPTRYNTDWPVIRLDNVPWSVTIKEIEAWLPPEKLLASDVESGRRATLAVHLLCNRTDGRTLNQAYLECASLAAAQKIVRARDGTYLGARPIHVSLSSQTELLQTIFPNYTPGFDGLKPFSLPGKKSAPIPLLLQTELTGLLELCKLQSAHSSKVPERPFFNIVTLLEKMPWEHEYSYNAAAIVRLFNTACAAIELLALVKSRCPTFPSLLCAFFDTIARCPVFRPVQVDKAAELARAAGLDVAKSRAAPIAITVSDNEPKLRTKVAVTPVRSPFGVTGVFDSFKATSTPAIDIANFTPSSLAQSCVTTSAKSPPLLVKSTPALDTSRQESNVANTSTPAKQLVSLAKSPGLASTPHLRRRSSLAEELGLDKNVIDSVAKALGIRLAK